MLEKLCEGNINNAVRKNNNSKCGVQQLAIHEYAKAPKFTVHDSIPLHNFPGIRYLFHIWAYC